MDWLEIADALKGESGADAFLLPGSRGEIKLIIHIRQEGGGGGHGGLEKKLCDPGYFFADPPGPCDYFSSNHSAIHSIGKAELLVKCTKGNVKRRMRRRVPYINDTHKRREFAPGRNGLGRRTGTKNPFVCQTIENLQIGVTARQDPLLKVAGIFAQKKGDGM
ncbi:hypothetical protein K435DRAFT_800260 [Dendrothele bispora CBS 962.96]|uniref:Uncharacterized protein n=1 Tax=Dendrothele bispora (strain CBS 962.96) TaxID=1314807 RepID=A0A4S8LT71_DENBC|nr:hypothetical protein K435DRAFT_800260 [Dendrothele bispora CBS 962.96]